MILAALACLLGQFVGVAHLALVRHATCAEHDALVHAPIAENAVKDTTEDATRDATRDATSTRPDRVAVGALPPEVAHEDDHCLAVGLGRKDLLAASPDQGPRANPPTPALDPLASPDHLTPASVPLLRLAPKSSPPAIQS